MPFSSQIQFSSIHRKSDTYLSWLKHSFQQFIMRAIYSLILGPYWSQFDFHQFIAKATHSVLGWLIKTDKQQRAIYFIFLAEALISTIHHDGDIQFNCNFCHLDHKSSFHQLIAKSNTYLSCLKAKDGSTSVNDTL